MLDLEKASQTWLKGFNALIRWFFTQIHLEEYYKSIIWETLRSASYQHCEKIFKTSLCGHGGCSPCAGPPTLALVSCLYGPESSESSHMLPAVRSLPLGCV